MKWTIPTIIASLLLSAGQVAAQSPPVANEEVRRLRSQIEQAEQELKALSERLKGLKESLAKLEGSQRIPATQVPAATGKLLFPFDVERAMMSEAINGRVVPLKPGDDPMAPQNRQRTPLSPRRQK